MQRLTRLSGIRGLSRDPPPHQQHQCRALHSQHKRRRRRLGPGASLRNTYRLFQMPEVVLDLDAENNPYVRQYDAADEEAQVAKWSANPTLDSLLRRQKSFSKDATRADKLLTSTASSVKPWRVTDQDLISAAILNPTSLSSITKRFQSPSEEFNQLLYHNGITSRMSDESPKMIHTLIHRQSIAQNVARPSHDYRRALMECHSFEELRRLTTQLVQTRDGCRSLSHCADSISRSLLGFLKDTSRDTVTKVLVLLNNISSNFAAKNLRLDFVLCDVALRAASIAGELAAVQSYLSTALRQHKAFQQGEVFTSRLVAPALTALLHNIQGRNSQVACNGTRTDLYTLLTGRSLSSGGIKPSFRATMRDVDYMSPIHTSYLALLGELGAIRTLWHDYRRLYDGKQMGSGEIDKQRLDVLVGAVLRHATPPSEDLASADVAIVGDKSSDAHLDLERLFMRDQQDASRSLAPDHLLTLSTPVLEVAAALPDPRVDGHFRSRVKEAFSQSQASAAMEALSELCASPFVRNWTSTIEHRHGGLAAISHA